MSEEAKKPKNPDYSDSAPDLTNAPEVKGLFDEWLEKDKAASALSVQLNIELKENPTQKALLEAEEVAGTAKASLEAAIVEFGGFQDVEQGLYALQQVRKLTTYDPNKIRKYIPEYADKILVQVDATRLKGLIKGGLVTQEQVAKCSEVKETKRFVIEARE